MIDEQKSLVKPVSLVLFLLAAVPGAADEPGVRWVRTGILPAPEAHQAAAAEERDVYAITNRLVARYDRDSGERVGVSSGRAEHLNSGFFWNGKLYCAHSNYPKQPEQSEIMVLDPETMQLTVFKDFGNFGGSLTWAIREGDHWWCNFAHYGEENAKTFLVQFDDRWSELGRWTYPPELISELGRYSLSGGIWRDGSLLVTGHDDPVFFRLERPESGSVLRYVEKQPVPITGQGFAADPRTGGIVGINRSRKQIIFAVPATEQ